MEKTSTHNSKLKQHVTTSTNGGETVHTSQFNAVCTRTMSDFRSVQ